MQPTEPVPEAWPGDDASPSLVEDWLTIWQSELAAMVLDRELQETQLALLDASAAQMRGRLRAASPPPAATGADDGRGAAAAGCAGPVPAPGTAALVAAPDARDAELERLAARVAELEGKLAGA